jgi:hypothetical protein
MERLMEGCRKLERESLERGEMPNPSLTSPEEALKYGWEIKGRDVKRLPHEADRAVPSPTDAEVQVPTIAQPASDGKPCARVPTINEWPEHERRGYDAYARELAHVEWVLEQERKGVYGQVRPAQPVQCVLTEEALRKSWPEWLAQADEQERQAWEAETDEIYAAEQLARDAALRDEEVSDL